MSSQAAATHAEVAEAFTRRVVGAAGRWDDEAPVPGWTARDVVEHLVSWLGGFLQAGAGVTLPSGPGVDIDPVATWVTHRDAVQALLDDPAAEAIAVQNPHVGQLSLPDAIDRFYTPDVFMHTWDLARATGQDATLDPKRCRLLVEAMEPIADQLYASGHYGPRVPVPEDADPQMRLLGLIGRDPTTV